jgi:glycerol kinase
VLPPKVTETTALGVAFLAGLAVGFWQDEAELAALWQIERRFSPAMSTAQRDELIAFWHKAVGRSRGWLDR